MVLTSRLRYTLYGTVLSASLISLSVSAGTADGVFGEYFKNIINTPCSYGYEVITGFSASSTNYGTRTCTSIATVLGNSTGNVGIGTLSPAAKLDVTGSIFVNGKGGMSYYNQAGYNQIEFGTPTGSSVDVSFHTSGVSKMWIKPSGNVGIGTATPTTKLDVAGTTKTDRLQLGNKFILSAVGDTHGNDNWIRMFYAPNATSAGGDAYGPTTGSVGLAVANLWARDNVYTSKITTPELCLNGICKTAWPTSGAGAGGIVTGPLRWSADQGAMSYDTAWSTCLGLAPAGQWRVPSSSDIELGRHANGGLFILTYSYWSSSPYFDAFWAWNPAYSYWDNCNAAGTYCTYYGYVPMALRCVSNS